MIGRIKRQQIRFIHAGLLRRRQGEDHGILLQWLLSAIALILASKLVPGFQVRGLRAALIAALVIGLLNATVGLVLKIITFPISILTFGIFLLVINGLMILVASDVVPGFRVTGMFPAFCGAVVLALFGIIIKGSRQGSKVPPDRQSWR